MALIPWWIRYPNVNDEIMNLDWLLRVSNENTEKISNFINLNTIKYADPILWDITSQYEANTITVDPQTGDAYISTKAVPYGVALSNTNYWTKIYNYANEMDELREQIAAANENLSTTATAPRAVGDLVWLNGLLYKVTAPMIAGDSYVVGSNCKKVTIEELIDIETQARIDADNTLQHNLDIETQARIDADNTLQHNLDIETQARIDAINELEREKQDKIPVISIKNYGAACDGLTDDTAAFKAALADSENKILLLEGTILVSKNINVANNRIIDGNNSNIITSNTVSGGLVGTDIIDITGNNVILKNLKIDGANYSSLNAGIIINDSNNVTLENVEVTDIYGRAIWIRDNNYNVNIIDCIVHDSCAIPLVNGGGAIDVAIGSGTPTNHNIHIENCYVYDCGNAGIEVFDCTSAYVMDCIVKDMSGSAGNWETANGYNVGSNCVIDGCIVKNCANTGFYVTGNNNIITSISVLGSGGSGIDLYTGSGNGSGNIIDGALLANCSTLAHPQSYNHMFIIGGTNQNVLTLSDIQVVGGGNNDVPMYGIEFDGLVGAVLDNINLFNITNMNKSILIRGNQSSNIIRNNRLDGDIQIDNPSASTRIYNNIGESNPFSNLSLTLGTGWTNNTGRTLAIYVSGGTITEIAIQNQITGLTSGIFILPAGYVFQINGSSLPTIKYNYI